MTPAHWESAASDCFGYMIGRIDPREAAIVVLINRSEERVAFTLPSSPGLPWQRAIDSADPGAAEQGVLMAIDVSAQSIVVLVSGGDGGGLR